MLQFESLSVCLSLSFSMSDQSPSPRLTGLMWDAAAEREEREEGGTSHSVDSWKGARDPEFHVTHKVSIKFESST